MSRQLNRLPKENNSNDDNSVKKADKLMINNNGDLSIVKEIKKDKDTEGTDLILVSYNMSRNINSFLECLTSEESANISSNVTEITKEN